MGTAASGAGIARRYARSRFYGKAYCANCGEEFFFERGTSHERSFARRGMVLCKRCDLAVRGRSRNLPWRKLPAKPLTGTCRLCGATFPVRVDGRWLKSSFRKRVPVYCAQSCYDWHRYLVGGPLPAQCMRPLDPFEW